MIDLGVFSSSIEHEVVYPHPPERVWRALTESDLLADWLMDNDLTDARVGETFAFHDEAVPPLWDGVVRCEVLAVERPELLRISWWGGGGNPETTVTWRLEPVDLGSVDPESVVGDSDDDNVDTVNDSEDTSERTGTRLSVSHEGLDGLRGLLMRFGMRGGWTTMYRERLPSVLARLVTDEVATEAGPPGDADSSPSATADSPPTASEKRQ
jgi:uncharacterized protein YndB with AHSA1/START domain